MAALTLPLVNWFSSELLTPFTAGQKIVLTGMHCLDVILEEALGADEGRDTFRRKLDANPGGNKASSFP